MATFATTRAPSGATPRPRLERRALLACGIAAALLYGAMNVFIPMLWREYTWTSQTLIMTSAVLGLVWPPMHLRPVLAAGGATLTDTLHIVWTAAWGLLSMMAMGFGAAAFGARFRFFTVVVACLLVAFGAVTSVDGPRVSAGLPTPWVGVWERLNIACYYVWVVVFAVALRKRASAPVG